VLDLELAVLDMVLGVQEVQEVLDLVLDSVLDLELEVLDMVQEGQGVQDLVQEVLD